MLESFSFEVVKRGRIADGKDRFDAGVGGVCVLATRTTTSGEAPGDLLVGNLEMVIDGQRIGGHGKRLLFALYLAQDLSDRSRIETSNDSYLPLV